MNDLTDFHYECDRRLTDLFKLASKTSLFELVYTLVRVDGMSDSNWDPFIESREAFDDYNELLITTDPEANPKRYIRLKILYYCHLIEASAHYELIANLLRCTTGSTFHIDPFGKLAIPKKQQPLFSVPPGVQKKLSEIKKIEAQSKVKISDLLDNVIHDSLRNSFVHSDYCLTDTEYRWTESGPAQKITIAELELWIEKAFAFYSLLFAHWKWIRRRLGKGKLVHPGPQPYETFEMTADTDGYLDGFKVHFSNGQIATFHRGSQGVVTNNIDFEKDGKINFYSGDHDKLKNHYVWNGNIVTDFQTLP